MKKLIGLLNQNTGVDGWKIAEMKTRSYELFFVHEKLETVRSTDTVSTSVTVYVDHDGARGDSSFAVTAAQSDKDLEKAIERAAARAKLAFNQPYRLPRGGREPERALPTNLTDLDEKETAAKIARAVFSADCPAGGSINALEVFLYTDTFRVINSEGIDKQEKKHRVMIEAIPTFTDEKESVELYEDYRFTVFDEEKLKNEISGKLREVYDRHVAAKPPVPMKANIVLRPHEIEELLSELAQDLHYASVYMHANLHKIGDDLQKDGKGDKLTVTMRGKTPGSERSSFFDGDGTELRDTTVIRDGVCAANFGSDRFGQYLGVETPSGELRCMDVNAGTLDGAELKSASYIECASLSGIQVDLFNDYIGGEIRLAYYFDGEKTVPVTGITMSGKLSEALASLRLSDKKVTQGAYEGPDKMLLPGFSIL